MVKDKKLYVVSTFFNRDFLIDLLVDYLKRNGYEENREGLSKLFKDTLSTPCLNYIFQEIYEEFRGKGVIYSDFKDILWRFYEDIDEEFTKIYVKQVVSNTSIKNPLDISKNFVVYLTEEEIKNYIKTVWEFIIKDSLKVPLENKNMIWFYLNGFSEKLRKSLEDFYTNLDTYIDNLVQYTFSNEIYYIDKEIIHLPEEYLKVSENFTEDIIRKLKETSYSYNNMMISYEKLTEEKILEIIPPKTTVTFSYIQNRIKLRNEVLKGILKKLIVEKKLIELKKPMCSNCLRTLDSYENEECSYCGVDFDDCSEETIVENVRYKLNS